MREELYLGTTWYWDSLHSLFCTWTCLLKGSALYLISRYSIWEGEAPEPIMASRAAPGLLDSLLNWFSTFPVSAPTDSYESFCDGVAMAQVNKTVL